MKKNLILIGYVECWSCISSQACACLLGSGSEKSKEKTMEMQAAEKCESLPRFRASSAQTKIWVIVTLRDDTCYSFRFPEWAKGQDVMDEVSKLS